MNGFMLVDKPAGMSSFQVVAAARRALGIRKIGHAGTLDPFATGLLIILVGKATRLMQWVVGHDKQYELGVQFGVTSDTDDDTGTIERTEINGTPSREQVQQAIDTIAARTMQHPPAVSAIHIDGERAYARVRRGEQIEIPARPVRIDNITMTGWDAESLALDLTVACGSGTYMRSIARDLGFELGIGGLATSLRRTSSGGFTIDSAIGVDDMAPAAVNDAIDLLSDVRTISLTNDEVLRVAYGQRLAVPEATIGERCALVADGRLIAIAGIEERDGAPRMSYDAVMITPEDVRP